jgi:hypothetical protein
MMTARAAMRAGWRDLWRSPAPTLLALVGAMAAALALRAANLRTIGLWQEALVTRGLVTWLCGAALALLLVDVTRAAALCAYAAAPAPDDETRPGVGRRLAWLMRPFTLGLLRTPAMITVRAVELTIYATLGLGELFVLGRGLAGVSLRPAPQALAVTACLAPALLPRGLPAATALAHGYDLVLRRFASLARLALFGALVTAPVWVGALLLPFGLRAALLSLVALWLYAALTTLVGRDPRLTTG